MKRSFTGFAGKIPPKKAVLDLFFAFNQFEITKRQATPTALANFFGQSATGQQPVPLTLFEIEPSLAWNTRITRPKKSRSLARTRNCFRRKRPGH